MCCGDGQRLPRWEESNATRRGLELSRVGSPKSIVSVLSMLDFP